MRAAPLFKTIGFGVTSVEADLLLLSGGKGVVVSKRVRIAGYPKSAGADGKALCLSVRSA